MSFRAVFLSLSTLVFVSSALAQAPPGAAQPVSDVGAETAGLGALQKNDLVAARAAFRAAVKSDPTCTSCLYNLGLVESRDGHIGLALGLWRKAAMLDRNYQAPRRAIPYAFTKLERQDISHELDAWESFRGVALEPVGPWIYSFAAALIFFLAGWRWIGWAEKSRKAEAEDRSTPPLPALAILLSIFFVLLLSLSVAKFFDDQTPRATVTAKTVPALSAPDAGSAALFDLYEGLETTVRDIKGDWVQVAYPGGGSGWVPKSALYFENSFGDSFDDRPEAKPAGGAI